MAVNKNFVVKNGLEVNENLIVANISDNFVGVGTSTPNNTLHVFGGIGATDVRVTGVSSFISNVYVGASGTTFSVIDVSGSLPAVGVGTDQPAYLVDIQGPAGTGYTSLYVKGDVRITGDIIADDLVFDQGNFSNVEVTGITTTNSLVVGFGASVAGISTFNRVDISGDTNITGVTTTASAGGITTTGGDLWVGNNFYVAGTQTIDSDLYIIGIATVGILTVTSDANVGGAVTIRGGLTVGTAGTIGFQTHTYYPDRVSSYWGDSNDLRIWHNPDTATYATNAIVAGSGQLLELQTDKLRIVDVGATQTLISADKDSYVYLFYDNTKRFETSPTGAVVTGILTATGIGSFGSSVNVVGAQFVGGNLTVGGDLNVTGDISYDEVTGRNLNITGIATIHTLGVTSTTTTQDLKVGAGATIDNALDIGSTIKMDATSGVITATTIKGVGEVIGIGSEGTPIGVGVSFIDFRSTTGTALSCQPAVNGIATVTVTPGASLGMVLALGG